MIHMFKAQFGLPPIQYMVRRRIGEAQHLLRTTEDSAGDIGGRVGMINRNYFYRMFKTSGGGIASSIPRGHWRTSGYAGLRKRLYGIERLLEKR